MIDERFSAKTFHSRGVDTNAARELAEDLRVELQIELHEAIDKKLNEIVRQLNSLGHQLKLQGESFPGEIEYRDYADGKCLLRLACDTVISTGYAHLISED